MKANRMTTAKAAGARQQPGRVLARLAGPYVSHEVQVVSLRECPLARGRIVCDDPRDAAAYWREQVRAHPYYNPDVENFSVLLLDTRRRMVGHQLVGLGTHDTVLCHPLQVFRAAVAMGAPVLILVHNHPSGDTTPSEGDIRATRDMIRAARVLKIEVVDHLVMGRGDSYLSLRALGYFYDTSSESEVVLKRSRAGEKVPKAEIEAALKGGAK